jgi:hypothetical protein
MCIKKFTQTNGMVMDQDLIKILIILLLYRMQNNKEYAYCQSYVRTSAVLPDVGQTE